MSGKLVMVVEDESDIRGLVEGVLQLDGYRVTTAANGLEALQRISEEIPQLVLLDMRMPVMDGWQFSSELRTRFDGTVPVVVVTASPDAAAVAREVGARGYLRKPFEIDELLAIVENHISSS